MGGLGGARWGAWGNRHKYYAFPRASASYRFTDLGELLNEVKLRGGWGRTGNRPSYGFRDVLVNVGSSIGGNASLVRAPVAGDGNNKNPTLHENGAGGRV